MQAIFLVTVFTILLVSADAAVLGETCTAPTDCTVTNSDCLSLVCKCKAGYAQSGTSCIAVGGSCPSGGTCTAPLVCDSSVCKIKAGTACTATADCVSQSTCSTTCNCNSGYTALTTGLCNGVAPQSVSFWLLTSSIITFLVTLSLP